MFAQGTRPAANPRVTTLAVCATRPTTVSAVATMPTRRPAAVPARTPSALTLVYASRKKAASIATR